MKMTHAEKDKIIAQISADLYRVSNENYNLERDRATAVDETKRLKEQIDILIAALGDAQITRRESLRAYSGATSPYTR